MGLPREMRFNSRVDFQDVLKSGVRLDIENFSIYYKGGDLGQKIGFIIPKEFGTAVVRNRVRRVLQDEFVKLMRCVDSSIRLIVRFYERKERAHLTRKEVAGIRSSFRSAIIEIMNSDSGSCSDRKIGPGIINSVFIIPIRAYQMFVSPILPPSCRFTPSCSEYAIGALKKYGIFYGLIKAIWRILRCNPLSEGGVDLP